MDALTEDSTSEAQAKLKFLNCFFGMLVHPKKTIRRIFDENIYFGLGWLSLCVVGSYTMLYLTQDWLKSILIIFLCVVFLAISIYVNSAILWLISKLLKGPTHFKKIVISKYWSVIPAILMHVIVCIAFPYSDHLKPKHLESILILGTVPYIFTIEALNYSEVQGWSVRKSFLNLFIAYVVEIIVIFVPLTIEAFIFGAALALNSHGIP
jgi:diacylglycerol kinase